MLYQQDFLDTQQSLTHDDISQEPAVEPLSFPTPLVHPALFGPITVLDHTTRRTFEANAIVRQWTSRASSLTATRERAYIIKRRLSRCKYGSVRLCAVLRRLNEQERMAIISAEDEPSDENFVCWESTDEVVAIKITSWSRLKQYQDLAGKSYDPLKEVAALQHVGNGSSYVIGCIEALQDEDRLYTVMPYCPGGDLYMLSRSTTFTEAQAKTWFRQLISGLVYLQNKGICHRGISLENLLINEKNNLVIAGFSLALRVPYTGSTNFGAIVDASEGAQRRLMKKQDVCGSLTYLAPEIIGRNPSFDGFAVDLWAAGCILFILLAGVAPFRMAHTSDPGYTRISRGELYELVWTAGILLSDNSLDLLQSMLLPDPRNRFTLTQIMHHPWFIERGDSSGNAVIAENRRVSFDLDSDASIASLITTTTSHLRSSVPDGVCSIEGSNHDSLPQAPQCPVPQQLHVLNSPAHRRSSSSTSEYDPTLSIVTQSPKRRHKRFVSDGSEVNWINTTFALATGSLNAMYHNNKSTTKQQHASKIEQKPGHKRHSSNRSFSLLPRRRGRVEEHPNALDVGNENARITI